jgi:hypothetical protein
MPQLQRKREPDPPRVHSVIDFSKDAANVSPIVAATAIEAYARRLRARKIRQFISTITFGIGSILLFIFTPALRFLLEDGVIFSVWLIFTFFNSRCPFCSHFFSINGNVTYCGRCGLTAKES